MDLDLGGIVRGLVLQTELIFSGAICALLIGLFVIFIFVAIWVYRDAESRGMSGVLWLLVVLVAGIIGLIIYLVVRSDHPVRPPGYMPGYYPPPPPPGGWPATQFPPPPGPPPATPGAVATVTCKSCGTATPANAKFCRQCGAAL